MIIRNLLPYRIIKIYISYKYGVSTVINRTLAVCPTSMTNDEIIDYITEGIIETQSPSKTIQLLSDNDIYYLGDAEKEYKHYDITVYFDRIDPLKISRYCEYFYKGNYKVINDILEKWKSNTSKTKY